MTLGVLCMATGCLFDDVPDGGGERSDSAIEAPFDGGGNLFDLSSCVPGEQWCVDLHRRAECLEDGTVQEEDCPEGAFCLDGACATQHCDSIEAGYCLITEGTFMMGAPNGDIHGQVSAEREVTLTRSYLMKAKEVTQGEWVEMFGTNPARYSACGLDCPIEMVHWWDALAYCNALSERAQLESCYVLDDCRAGETGEWEGCECAEFLGLDCQGYRLPTEAEWEYAARAGTTTDYSS